MRARNFTINTTPNSPKKLLKEGNYKGEEVVLLTDSDYDWMYTEGLVMAEQ